MSDVLPVAAPALGHLDALGDLVEDLLLLVGVHTEADDHDLVRAVGDGNARDCTNPSDPFCVTAFQRTRYPFCPATVTAFDASTSCEVIRPYDSPP